MEITSNFNTSRYATDFQRHGYSVCNSVFSEEEVEQLRWEIASITDGEAVRRKGSVYGIRNLWQVCPAVRLLAVQPRNRQFVVPILGDSAFAVGAIFFDKVSEVTWAVGWHQDSDISVSARRDVPGFTPWSRKAGVWQVQPPAEVLARMVAVRVHLDDCPRNNGPLRVIPGTHCHGWLDGEIDDWKRRGPEVSCSVDRGGVVAMCPLTLHASSASESIGHRRVIHLEYARDDLPGGLDWNHRVGQSVAETPAA